MADRMISGAVVVVDSNDERRNYRTTQLRLAGWGVAPLPSPQRLRPFLSDRGADLVIFGEITPENLDVIRDTRARRVEHANTGQKFVVLGVADDDTAVASYNAGANLVLPAGASPHLINAACENLATSQDRQRATVTKIGDMTLDRDNRALTVNGETLRVSRTEYELLDALTTTPNTTLSREELSECVYHSRVMGRESRGIDRHIASVNRKARDAGGGKVIENVWGHGWKLADPVSDTHAYTR